MNENLIHKYDNFVFNIRMRTSVVRLRISCWLWNFGGYGFPICEEHGFYHQSSITGKCRKCQSSNGKVD